MTCMVQQAAPVMIVGASPRRWRISIAEVAVAGDPGWRRVGLATALIRLLAAGAVSHGVHRFSAELVEANQDVRELFAETGLPYQTTPAVAGVVTIEVALPADAADLL